MHPPSTSMNDHYWEGQIKVLLYKTQQSQEAELALQSLRTLDREHLLQVFRAIFANDFQLRDLAIKAVFAIDPYRAIELLLPALHDADATWRWYVCSAFADYGDERVVLPLTEVLVSDPDADTRFMAAVALAKIGDTHALAVLRHAEQFDRGADYEGRRVATMAAEAIRAILTRESSSSS